MPSTTILMAVGAFLATTLLLFVFSIWSRSQALKTIKQWAKAEGFELIKAQRRSIVPVWRSGKGYQFFRITVRDVKGCDRKTWIRCLDFNSAEPWNIEVTWDEE